MNRAETIASILAASSDPLPEIVATYEHQCSDGKWRGALGIPMGMSTTGEIRVRGYVYQDPRNGTTYSPVHFPTNAAALEWAQDCRARKCAEFRTILEAYNDEQLAKSAKYWLKRQH